MSDDTIIRAYFDLLYDQAKMEMMQCVTPDPSPAAVIEYMREMVDPLSATTGIDTHPEERSMSENSLKFYHANYETLMDLAKKKWARVDRPSLTVLRGEARTIAESLFRNGETPDEAAEALRRMVDD